MNKNKQLIKKRNGYLTNISNKISITDKIIYESETIKNIKSLNEQLTDLINKKEWRLLLKKSIEIIQKYPDVALGYVGHSESLYYLNLPIIEEYGPAIISELDIALKIIDQKGTYNYYKNLKYGDPLSSLKIYILYYKAEVYFLIKNKEMFIEQVKKMMKFDSNSRLSKILHITILTQTKDFSNEDKLNYFNWLIENKLETLKTYYSRGHLFEELGNIWAAISDFNKAIEVDPHYKYSYLSLALVLADIKQYQDAIKMISKVIDLDASNPDYFIARSIWEEEIGDLEGTKLDKEIAEKLKDK
ncbi:MAG: hypothetical protein IPH62_05995 [Ignavibacteriae bacterium]|nr:hypothetical protein [Ignavibacteriota bacterium]